jgi:hypothetical protein
MYLTRANTDPRDGDPEPPNRAAEAERVSDEPSQLAARLCHTEGHDGASGGHDRASNGDTILPEHAAPVDALPDPPPVLGFSSTSEAIELGLLEAPSLAPCTGSSHDGDPEPPNRAAEAERVSDEPSQLAARLRHTEGPSEATIARPTSYEPKAGTAKGPASGADRTKMTILRDLNDWLPVASETELTMALRAIVEAVANRADARVAEDLVVERARADFRAGRLDVNGVVANGHEPAEL